MATARDTGAPGRSGPLRSIAFRYHVLIPFVAVVAILGFALALAAGASSRRMVQETAVATFTGAATMALRELDRLQQSSDAAVTAIAFSSLALAHDDATRNASIDVLHTVLRSVPEVSAAYVGWPDGVFLLMRRAPADAAARFGAPDGTAWILQRSGNGAATFEFLDSGLGRLGLEAPRDHLFDPRTRPWYIDAQIDDRTVVTAPYVFFTTREPGISAARRAPSGAVAGVDMSLLDLSQMLPTGAHLPSIRAAVIDAAGGVLAYNERTALDRALRSVIADDGQPVLPPLASFGAPVLEAAIRQGGAWSGSIDLDSGTWIAAVVPLNDGLRRFIMAAPLAELDAGATMIRNRLLAIFVLSGLLVLPLTWVWALRVARPVEQYATEIGRFAALDLAPQPPRRTGVTELDVFDSAMQTARRRLAGRLTAMQCLYHVLELTADSARPMSDTLDAVAQTLRDAMPDPARATVRIATDWGRSDTGGADERGAALTVPVPYPPGRSGTLSVRTGVDDLSPGDEAELRDLASGVASHLARMAHNRQLVAELSQSERLRSIGQLTGGVAHDFNNLLTVIVGNLETLSERLADRPDLLRPLAITAQAADRAADLTRRLLAFGRNQPLQPRAVDLAVRLDDMERLLRQTLPSTIAIRVEVPPDLPPVMADQTQLDVAILNLAINARDAMPEGGDLVLQAGRATVDADAPPPGAQMPVSGDFVVLSVTDTGTGMDAETALRAFEPFFTTKDIGKGSGLGLSTVHGFVKQSRGFTAIDSVPGAGTTVRLYLPVAGSQADGGIAPGA